MTGTIVLVFDHFAPDYSAGGPVTSLVNLASMLSPHASVRVITSAFQFRPRQRLANVTADEWSSVGRISIWYASDAASVARAVASLPTDATIYLNGVFSPTYFLHVAQSAKKLNLRIVISPRGMLQQGALRGKYWKKVLYLKWVKILGVANGATWHATDEQERADIERVFGRVPIVVAPNIPRQPLEARPSLKKEVGQLRLVYFSLITEKKNLLFLLKMLAHRPFEGVTLDIVGPIKDAGYWTQCQQFVNGTTIRYLGDRTPDQVFDTITSYHGLVLPTKGENYGHAIVESLGAWRPVMISEFTPWRDLGNAGCALPLQEANWQTTIGQWVNWSQNDFDQACDAAIGYFRRHVNMNQVSQQYLEIFRAAQ